MVSPNHGPATAFLGCVPHVPFIMIQERAANQPFWDAYQKQAEALAAFDPEIIFVFGSDHYSGQHLQLMAPFIVGQAADAIKDDGGFPGKLQVPPEIAISCAEHLIDAEFDVATSFAMEVDHGFSSVLHHFLGSIDAKPTVPIFVNALCHPRPTMRRCRKLGTAVGDFAAGLGKRVAFLASGGLSHETGEMFPQFDTAPDDNTRDYIVHGGRKGAISRETWLQDIHTGLQFVNGMLLDKVPGVGDVNQSWDDEFLQTFAAGKLELFDDWTDADMLARGGNGAGEVRQWITAAAAAQQAGAGPISIDFYQQGLPMGVAAVVAHA